MASIRVFLVADRLLCDLLTSRLARGRETAVVGQCHPDEQWADVATSRAVDVVVLDLGSIPPTWPGLMTKLRERRPGVRLVALGDERDDTSAVSAARAGAAGWLLPGSGLAALVDAVVAVHRGAAVYPPQQLASVLEALRADVVRAEQPSGRFTSLTARELEVLGGLVDGYPAHELAERLGLAVNTIRTHTNRVFKKLGVHGRLEAVRLAHAEGLAPTRAEERSDVPRPSLAFGDHQKPGSGVSVTRLAQ